MEKKVKSRSDIQEAELIKGKSPDSENWGIEPQSGNGLLHTEMNGEVVKKNISSLRGNYSEYYEGIYEAIRNNKPLPVKAEEAMSVIKVIEAAIKSNQEKRVITI
jgi:scyllo-inositol 2-dehydrogenase (NADP+)